MSASQFAVVYTAVKICESAAAAKIQHQCIARQQREQGIAVDAKVVARSVTLGEWYRPSEVAGNLSEIPDSSDPGQESVTGE